MISFKARNINDMAMKVYPVLERKGVERDSRNGRVLVMPDIVSLEYTEPNKRACFIDGRDANPFFHIAEAMWMLAGRNDVSFLNIFNSNMKNYSDDGVTFNAAYGYRLRHHFGFDQLQAVVDVLAHDMNSRQAICQLWDAQDLLKTTKDKACNMSMVFSMPDEDHVELTVYNRSNDAVYGNITGANPVHFSYFLQWGADQLEVQMGSLTFVTTNLHVYLDLYPHWAELKDPKEHNIGIPSPLGRLKGLDEIERLCNYVDNTQLVPSDFSSSHLNSIVSPIINAWMCRKFQLGNYHAYIMQIADADLQLACHAWIGRRK